MRSVMLALVACLVPVCGALAAEEDDAATFTLDIGGGGLVGPAFEGARDVKATPIPYVSFDYKDTVFLSVLDGFGVNAINAHGLRAGPVLNVAFPRSRSDDRSALKGLDNIDAGLQAGGFINYEVMEGLSVGVEALQTVTGLGIEQGGRTPKGLSAEASVTVSAPPLAGEKLFLSATPSITYYDKSYSDTYFGVSGGESGSSGYKEYHPDGGLAKAGVAVVAVYGLTETLSLEGFGQYERLLGDIARSPLVKGSGGSANQFAAGAALSYRFSFK